MYFFCSGSYTCSRIYCTTFRALCQAFRQMFRLFRSRLFRCQPCRLLCTRAGCRSFPCPLAPHILTLSAVLIGHGAAAVVVPVIDFLRLLAVFIPPCQFRAPCTALAVCHPRNPAFQPGFCAEGCILLHEIIVEGHAHRRRRAGSPDNLLIRHIRLHKRMRDLLHALCRECRAPRLHVQILPAVELLLNLLGCLHDLAVVSVQQLRADALAVVKPEHGAAELLAQELNFNSHAPCGARPVCPYPLRSTSHFNSHAPCGARQQGERIKGSTRISTHTPLAGRDPPPMRGL